MKRARFLLGRAKRPLVWLGLAVQVSITYLLFWPVPIAATRWTPEPAPSLTGVYQRNRALARISRIGSDTLLGSEDVAFDSKGRAHFGTRDGSIWRLASRDTTPKRVAALGGPILGMAFDHEDNLVVAAPGKGLVSVSKNGKIDILTSGVRGRAFQMPNDLDIAGDGTVYFSDSSRRHGYGHIYNEVMEAGPNGRLLKYDMQSGETTVLLDGLCFANGVAVGPDDAYVLVNEMTRYRTRRYWISGPKKGRDEIFIDNLPGMPDGISFNNRNTFWMALYATRAPALDNYLYPHPLLREMLFRFPQPLRPRSPRYGFVIGLTTDGGVAHNYQDPTGSFSPVSNVVEHQGTLYLGSTIQRGVGIFRL